MGVRPRRQTVAAAVPADHHAVPGAHIEPAGATGLPRGRPYAGHAAAVHPHGDVRDARRDRAELPVPRDPGRPVRGSPRSRRGGRTHVPRPDRPRPQPHAAQEAAGSLADLRAAGVHGDDTRAGRPALRSRAGPAVPAAHRDRGRSTDRARPHRRAGRRDPAAGDGARAGVPRGRGGAADQPTARGAQHRGRSAALRDRRAGGVHRARHAADAVADLCRDVHQGGRGRPARRRRHLERDRRDAARDAAQRHHRDEPGPVAAGVGRPGAPRPADAHSACRARCPVPRRRPARDRA